MTHYTTPESIYPANDTDGVVEVEMSEAEWIDLLISINAN